MATSPGQGERGSIEAAVPVALLFAENVIPYSMSSNRSGTRRSDNYLVRPRLHPLLRRKGIRLLLLAGYAGSGKTALVREWLQATGDVRAAWVRCGTDCDGTSPSFWAAVLERLSNCDKRYAGPTGEQ